MPNQFDQPVNPDCLNKRDIKLFSELDTTKLDWGVFEMSIYKRKSAIPYLQRLLNNEHLKRKAEFHDLQTSDGVRKRVKTKDNSYLVNYVS